ncbi:protein-export chaperone SecB [Croceicoccus gelatinilyticus]|uniref:protein-export chaperone SecB n=1 Tax=Croceicoccus gelatinilyticus TaxID=2835536 RepID=UPI001BCDC6F6|nr:protein-export chaperone SecB [Croceicoccus gelatinilyticus]MBS7670187.1 protein-export chaperone SecB [Croceicoccus gelatinilyticus]
MADEGNIITDLGGNADANQPNGADNQPAIGLISQYIKDLSVENPNAPKSYQFPGQPNVDVQFNINSTPVEGEVHEVVLKITVTAKAEQGALYIVDLAYGGLIGMRNVPAEQGHMFLYAEAPRILFPFARRIIADAVRDAGFPPMLLDPIDFQGIYIQQLQQRQAQGENPAAAAPTGEA